MKKEAISVYLNPEILEKLRAIAEKRGNSVSSVIREKVLEDEPRSAN